MNTLSVEGSQIEKALSARALNFMFSLLLKMFVNDRGHIFRDFQMPYFLILTYNGSQKTKKSKQEK